MGINDLPDEILYPIFSLASQTSNDVPCVFKTGNDFRDCVILVDISRVCHRWEDVLKDSLIWSSFCICLQKPTAESLRRVTHFANIHLKRSGKAPLTCFISLSPLEDLRLAHDLMLALVAHEDRWSRIAIDITPSTLRSRALYALTSAEESENEFAICIKEAGKECLREFHFNIGSWFNYSMSEPLPLLETLRIADYRIGSTPTTLAIWLPLAPNLVELDIVNDEALFSHTSLSKMRIKALSNNHHFILPKLRTLRATPHFLSNLTCPALEKYAMGHLPASPALLECFRNFIERSAPPVHTLVIKSADVSEDFETARAYFIPKITTLSLAAPNNILFEILTEKSQERDVPRILTSLKYLQLSECDEQDIEHISSLITTRWGVASSRRSLNSVRLTQWASSIPKFMSLKPISRIQLKKVNSKWREIARCAKEGLQFSIERNA
ncbi:hypothetical protein SCHPADRAFT_1000758 [Schizopora paradoxa]|uniref:F-box domain-containing protein n=1 Tax=Schizopora paradoxa TaxID=27342 RepID=A0A0H2RGS9_9AGAM|nr:hypothetical protein SCHPADRAFT_1000758 [Schizopora paradoxa]